MKYKLHEVFEFIRNGANIKQGIEGGYPITRIETISDRYINRNKMGYAGIYDLSKYEDYLLKDGDILMSHINSEIHLGKSAIYQKKDPEEKIIHGMNLLCLRPNPKIIFPKYVFYYFNTHFFKMKLNKIIKKSVNQASFSVTDLKKIEIDIPNIDIQIKIANTLDKAQELIDKRNAQIEALDQLTQSVFLEMFGSIRGEKLPLSELCEINPPKREVADLKEDTIVSFIPMANVSETGEIDLSETRNLGEVYKGFTYFKENDVLFAKITPCMENGKGAIAKNLTNEVGFGSTEFHVLRPKEGITSEWLYYLTTLPNFRQQAEKNMTGSAGQKRVPKQFFDKYKVNKPTIESQEEFKKIILKINSQKEMLKKSLAILDTNFQSLMQLSFKGELFTEEKV
ncbi:restriction endonuclease subunit S [Calidifontibacillus erzurumensis]|uniref:Restriction endonuclease subunit S n=1 Tax=Calidifontibacillus erzurumensis TaxID=2741433 RepID=A0A8J8GFM0_9BACI|nr:restriction endonuclease subunit S [Calidifontibacillus erzurumensis]NSL52757.1 restriction endonuclease subunit S [Calidifontibacillus erzurumensis]